MFTYFRIKDFIYNTAYKLKILNQKISPKAYCIIDDICVCVSYY